MQLVYLGMNKEYIEFIRTLRNDQRIKPGFISQGYITESIHEEHMSLYANNYYICLIEDEPVGFVGHVEGDIRFAVSPEHQGKGVGTFMLDRFLFMKHSHKLSAKIKYTNTASIRAFEKAGFKNTFVIMEPPKI